MHKYKTGGEVGNRMSNVIVKENESLDSALRRFKRSCAKAGIQQEIRQKRALRRNQAFVRKKNLEADKENVNIINCAQKSLAVLSGIFIIIWTIIRGRK